MKTKLVLAALALCLSSCTLDVREDGSKNATVDSAALLKAIQVFADK